MNLLFDCETILTYSNILNYSLLLNAISVPLCALSVFSLCLHTGQDGVSLWVTFFMVIPHASY